MAIKEVALRLGWLLAASAFALSGLMPIAASAETFQYDSLGRLVSVVGDDGKQRFYSYDKAGNRTEVTVATGVTRPFPLAVADVHDHAYGPASSMINVLTNDSGVGGVNPTLLALTQPLYGRVAISGTQVVYEPPASQIVAKDQFTYSIRSETTPPSPAATATVVVNLIGSPPTIVPDLLAFGGGSASINPTLNDAPGTGSLTLTSVQSPPTGSVSVAGNTATYTPATPASGDTPLTYTVRNSAGLTGTGTVTFRRTNTVTAVADALLTSTGETRIKLVTENDTTTADGPLTVVAVGAAAHGVTGHGDATVTYTSATGFSGSDTFTYTVRNQYGETASANVSVTVSSTANRAPVIANKTVETQLLVGGPTFSVSICTVGPGGSDPDGDAPLFSDGPTQAIEDNRRIFVVYEGCTLRLRATAAPDGPGTVTWPITVTDGRPNGVSAPAQITAEVIRDL